MRLSKNQGSGFGVPQQGVFCLGKIKDSHNLGMPHECSRFCILFLLLVHHRLSAMKVAISGSPVNFWDVTHITGFAAQELRT